MMGMTMNVNGRRRVEVSYCWSEDGVAERCVLDAGELDGVACHHCSNPIDRFGVVLRPLDGGRYAMHVRCALDWCAGHDAAAIRSIAARASTF